MVLEKDLKCMKSEIEKEVGWKLNLFTQPDTLYAILYKVLSVYISSTARKLIYGIK